jgi:thiamine pyrophosphate-dependent acetolactate synthase large subunit-like protein
MARRFSWRSLEREGVEYVFAYPGGAMPLHQALTKSKKIRTILPRHEQGGGFAAEGYARVTGKAGVCMATSGPGHESRDLHCRCLHGFRAAGGDHRTGAAGT